MTLRRSLILAACGLAVAGAASAQDGDMANYSPKEQMALAVMTHVSENNLTGLLDDEFAEAQMLLRLSLIAKQFALAETCEGFELEGDLYTSVLNDVMSPFAGLVEEGQNNLVVDRAMFGYATLLGGELTLAAFDPDAFCAFGTELRAEFTESDTDGKVLVLAPAE